MPFLALRPFQRKFIDAVIDKFQQPGDFPKKFIANVAPGSGKTLSALAAADALMESGAIDTVVHLSPRINLARQMEFDSTNYLYSPMRKALNIIERRENIAPLLRNQASGYATTYASLVSDIGVHMDALQKRKVLLICDELQQLGADYGGNSDSASTRAVQELAQLCTMVIGMTGTPYRADGNRLLFAKYSDPDSNGVMRLNSDIEATYRMGVAEGYLRKFEFHLFDGGVDWNKFGTTERIEIAEMDSGLWRILENPDFWHPLIDKFVEIANEQRRLVSPDLRDLIAVYNQKQATEIQAYLKKRHNIEALKAISQDGDEAQSALEEFKRGRYTTLVTVNMAYIGYDYKNIAHICALTGYRTEGYLHQFSARGLRVIDGIPVENQTCYMVAPNDPGMAQFTSMMQGESNAGLRDRQEQQRVNSEREKPEQIELGYAESAWLGDMMARGYHAEGDAIGDAFRMVEEKRRQLNIATPTTQLMAFMKSLKVDIPVIKPSTPPQPPFRTERDREIAARKELSDAIRSLTGFLLTNKPDSEYQEIVQTIWIALTRRDGKRAEQRNLDELHACIKLVSKWHQEGKIV